MFINGGREMINYREIRKNEVKDVAEMVANSFGEYPMYTLVFRDLFKNKEDFIKYMAKLDLVHLKANARKHKCFVGIEEGEIASVAILQDPSIKRLSVFDYILSGGISLLFPVGFRKILSFFDISNIAHVDTETEYKDSFYIELLAVNPKIKGKGYGSKMIKECIIPYVRTKKGKKLTLITNTESNYHFYLKNGFKCFVKRKLSYKEKEIDNYSFYMDLDDK